jgi:hypothetical protein
VPSQPPPGKGPQFVVGRETADVPVSLPCSVKTPSTRGRRRFAARTCSSQPKTSIESFQGSSRQNAGFECRLGDLAASVKSARGIVASEIHPFVQGKKLVSDQFSEAKIDLTPIFDLTTISSTAKILN